MQFYIVKKYRSHDHKFFIVNNHCFAKETSNGRIQVGKKFKTTIPEAPSAIPRKCPKKIQAFYSPIVPGKTFMMEVHAIYETLDEAKKALTTLSKPADGPTIRNLRSKNRKESEVMTQSIETQMGSNHENKQTASIATDKTSEVEDQVVDNLDRTEPENIPNRGSSHEQNIDENDQGITAPVIVGHENDFEEDTNQHSSLNESFEISGQPNNEIEEIWERILNKPCKELHSILDKLKSQYAKDVDEGILNNVLSVLPACMTDFKSELLALTKKLAFQYAVTLTTQEDSVKLLETQNSELRRRLESKQIANELLRVEIMTLNEQKELLIKNNADLTNSISSMTKLLEKRLLNTASQPETRNRILTSESESDQSSSDSRPIFGKGRLIEINEDETGLSQESAKALCKKILEMSDENGLTFEETFLEDLCIKSRFNNKRADNLFGRQTFGHLFSDEEISESTMTGKTKVKQLVNGVIKETIVTTSKLDEGKISLLYRIFLIRLQEIKRMGYNVPPSRTNKEAWNKLIQRSIGTIKEKLKLMLLRKPAEA